MFDSRYLRTIDWAFLVVPLLLVAYGLAILYSFSFGGQKNLALFALVYAGLGVAVMIFLTLLDYRTLRSLSWYLYGLVIILLLLVAFFGDEVFGVRRWLDLGVIQLQPAEPAKLVLILLLAGIAAGGENLTLKRLLWSLVIIVIPVAFVLRQPDLGTAVVLLVLSAVIIAYAKPPRFFWPALIIIGFVAAPAVYANLRPYQKQRIQVFLNPTSDPTGVGYNVTQAKIAIGSGGIWGRGLGQGSQSQLNFLPVAHTDFIFSAVAEASGFAGSVVLVGLFAILVWRALNSAMISQDVYGYFVALAIGTMFLFQAVVNVGMNLGLMPVTGIPLPFVSFGGSGMLTNFAAVGILQSIYIRHKKIRFG